MKYKLLGNSGLRISEAALGTMTFGDAWNKETNSWGVGKEESQKVFNAYAEAGGNFLDTSNFYTNGQSEEYLSDFIAADRDHFVVATKYSLIDGKPQDPNYMGNHRKNMIRSLEGSLKRLKTDFVDILYLHAWDFTTPVEEVMRAFDDMVRAGKVRYIGISDTPAWVISKANTIAEFRGYSKFIASTIEYNLLERTAENDVIPMSNDMGLGVTVWSPLAGGTLTGKYLHTNGSLNRMNQDYRYFTNEKKIIVENLGKIGDKLGITPAQVSLRWLVSKSKSIIPIIGARTLKHLQENLEYLTVGVPDEDLRQLDEISASKLIFPQSFLKEAQYPIYGETVGKLEGINF